MFFFHPFSRTKIDLPKFPVSELSDHVAAFSSPPTSQDCTVCVVSRRSGDELELNVLHCGASEWIQHKYDHPIDTIKCAAYVKEEFYFFDSRDELITLSTKDLSWRRHIIVSCKSKKLKSPDQFFCRRDYFQSKDIRKKLGLAADASISIRGTQMQPGGVGTFVFNETITGNRVQESKSRKFKGVWIHPRFYLTSPKHESW